MRSVDFSNHPEDLEKCWAFVRGDMDVSTFENWLYFEKNAEIVLGPEEFLDAVSTDFGNRFRVNDLIHRLSEVLPPTAACQCHLIPSRHLVSIFDASVDTFDLLEGEVGEIFWLHRARCKVCATGWWVVEESRIYDVRILFRGWANRPAVNTYRELLTLTAGMGAQVHYVDPRESFEIPAAIAELAKEAPGIAVSDLARLLPIPAHIVQLHARRISQEVGLNIDLEH